MPGILETKRPARAGRLLLRGRKLDTDPEQGKSEPSLVWDFVFSGQEPKWGLNYAVGVYNAFDWRYATPLSAEFRQRSLVQNGRTLLATAGVTF